MPTLDKLFERELEIFRTEAGQCAQFLFAFLAVHDVAYRKKAIHRLLNRAPLFWNTCLGALQASAFMALGRVFDSDSPHNINQLLKLAQNNRLQLFSKAALGRRKQGNDPEPPEWLDEYLQRAREPTADDFRSIRKRVAGWRRVYEVNYRAVRHQFFAHKQVAEEAEVTALFSKGTNRELQQLIAFLGTLHDALWQLFFNGRKLVLRPSRYSLSEMRRRPKPTFFSNRAVQEIIAHEVQAFLLFAAKRQ
ncbi:MAG TPA: hypothetical protein VF532_04525 [Candidatus Angelobacter sp.]